LTKEEKDKRSTDHIELHRKLKIELWWELCCSMFIFLCSVS
jgi:hypothetical protein